MVVLKSRCLGLAVRPGRVGIEQLKYIRMDKTLRQLFLDSFSKFKGFPGVVVSLLLGYLFWVFSPDLKIPFSVFLPILLVLGGLIVVLFDLLDDLYGQVKIKWLPKVIRSIKYPNGDTVLLLSESKLLTVNSIVSIYYDDNDFEQLIGFGVVVNIQENGKIQIGIHRQLPGFDERFKSIANNNITAIARVVIKPNTPSVYLEIKD